MKKLLFSLTLFCSLSLTSAEYHTEAAHDHNEIHSMQAFTQEEAEYIHPDSVRADYLTVRGMEISGFSGESLDKLQNAFAVLEVVMNSEEFKERVLNFKNTQDERAFASNKGLTNEEIYELIMEGREDLQPDTSGEMNFFLKLYNKPWSRVVGYTTPDTNLININWKFFKNFGPHQVAGNLAHEWLHKMGYGHRSAREHDSVPYAIGNLVRELAEKHLASH
jgi:hypothetical protein